MKISPLDIRQTKFRKSLNGYDQKEVDSLMELVAAELEKVLLESNNLKDEHRRVQHQVMEFQERESILKDTLITAQKVTTDIKSNAQKESELIIKQAEIQAEKIINVANQRLAKLIGDIGELKRQRANLESSLRHVLESHGNMLEIMGEEEKKADSPEEKIKILAKSQIK